MIAPGTINALLLAIPPTITGLLAWLKARDVAREQVETNVRVQEVHLSVNSRLDELIRVTRLLAHAEGVKEGMQSQIISQGLAAQAAAVASLDPALPPEPKGE